MSVKAVARAFVARSEELGFKGKKRDDLAVEFFLGAYVGAHACANGDENSPAGKLANNILATTSMLICTRGYSEVKRLAESAS